METEDHDLGLPFIRYENRTGLHLGDPGVAGRRLEKSGVMELEIFRAQTHSCRVAASPSLKSRLVQGLPDGDRRALRLRFNPNGIGSRALRRNEAVENHQTVVAGLIFAGLAVNRQNPGRGG